MKLFALVVVCTACCLLRATAFTVCVIPDGKWTSCTVNDTSPSSFSGYDVELFRFMSAQVSWAEDPQASNTTVESGQWAFRCSEIFWDNLLPLLAGEGDQTDMLPCAAAIGNFIPKWERYEMGVQFSAPYYHTGLAIMVAVQPEAPFDIWGFLKPFDWVMWVVLLLTLLLMPGIVWYVEHLNVHGFIPLTWSSVRECQAAIYTTMLACFNIQVYDVTTLPAQLVVVVYLFLIMITISTYVANLAAVFTNNGGTVATITSWKDLRNKPVATPGLYVDGLHSRYGLSHLIPGGDGSNLGLLLDGKAALLNGSIGAYVTNLESLQEFLGAGGYNDDCSLGLVLFDVLEPAFNFAFAFHHRFPLPVLMHDVNMALAVAEENGLLFALHEKYLNYTDVCSSATASATSSQSVHFYQLSGLWILLASALGFALCWSLVMLVVLARRHMRHIALQRHSLTESDSVGGSMHKKTRLVGEAMSRVFISPSMARSLQHHADLDAFPEFTHHTTDTMPTVDSTQAGDVFTQGLTRNLSCDVPVAPLSPTSSAAAAAAAAGGPFSISPQLPPPPPLLLPNGGGLVSASRFRRATVGQDGVPPMPQIGPWHPSPRRSRSFHTAALDDGSALNGGSRRRRDPSGNATHHGGFLALEIMAADQQNSAAAAATAAVATSAERTPAVRFVLSRDDAGGTSADTGTDSV